MPHRKPSPRPSQESYTEWMERWLEAHTLEGATQAKIRRIFSEGARLWPGSSGGSKSRASSRGRR